MQHSKPHPNQPAAIGASARAASGRDLVQGLRRSADTQSVTGAGRDGSLPAVVDAVNLHLGMSRDNCA